MHKDVANYVSNSTHCQVAEGYYTGPKTQIGSLISNNLLDLLCIHLPKWTLLKTVRRMYSS